MFKSIDIDDDGVGTIWLYPLIPSDRAGEREATKPRLEDFPEPEDGGIYVAEQFLNVTVKVSNFERRIYEEFEGETRNAIALYYLDLAAPERFFGYLSFNIADVSHWFYSNADMREFIS